MKAFDYVTGVGSAAGIGLQLTDWVEQAAAAGEIPPGYPLAGVAAGAVTGRAVLEYAQAGDPWAQGLVTRAGGLLAGITAVFGSLYDPELALSSLGPPGSRRAVG